MPPTNDGITPSVHAVLSADGIPFSRNRTHSAQDYRNKSSSQTNFRRASANTWRGRGSDGGQTACWSGGPTSNRPVEDWGKVLGDAAVVAAMLDRLLHHGHVLKCGPRSWRTPVGENLPTEENAR
jgi:hypothetical protein